MHKAGWFFVLVLGISVCRLPAAAQSISYSQTLDEFVGGSNGYQEGDVMGSYLQSFSLPQFSPTLGNLNSVELTVSTTTTIDFDYYTYTHSYVPPDFVVPDGSYSFQADYFLIQYDAASNTILDMDLSQSLSGTSQGVMAYEYSDHFYFQYTATALDYNATSQQILPSDPNFATHLGSGNLNFDINFVYDIGQYGISDSYSPFIISNTLSDSQLLVTVTYDYSPLAVPEPSSLTLLAGLCLAGGSHLSRRRRRAKQLP